MPFPGLIALGFNALEDSQYFQDMPVDPSIKYEVTGGFMVSRPRYTRLPNHMLTTGYTAISDANKQLLDEYWASLYGPATPFSYVHPTTGVTLNVKFDDTWKTKYVGAGTTFLWDITDIKLRSI